MTDKGFVLLVEAMMEQAYKDLNDKDKAIREDAEKFIEEMKKNFSN